MSIKPRDPEFSGSHGGSATKPGRGRGTDGVTAVIFAGVAGSTRSLPGSVQDSYLLVT